MPLQHLLITFFTLGAEPVEAAPETRSPAVHRVLIDVAENLRLAEWSVDASSADLETQARWSVRKHVLHGGKQEGVDVVDVDNGVLSFRVLPTRGMGLWNGRCEDLELGWDSPVDEIVHPSNVELGARGGLGWLEGFGEWINRCGLESNGAPGVDLLRSNTGAIVPVQLTLHGKAAYLPARRVEVIIEPAPSRRIIIRGVVDEVAMFGPRLRLVSEISTELGSKTLRIVDEIQNLGARPQEMQILYHCNFGAPLLEEGASFVAPVRRVFPRDARAAEGGMDGWNRFQGPDPSYIEQVYFLELFADAAGRTSTLLRNRAGDRGVELGFSTKELPYMTLWKNTAARENGYVTGLEPATNYPNHRGIERQHGRVRRLAPGESHRAELSVTALTDARSVSGAERRIASLATAPTRVDTTPEEHPPADEK
jgi:hypothetical protein